jgi:2'-5' RNA ligase
VLGAPPLELVHRDAHPRAVERGIPFHITLLYPFLARAELHDDDLERVRSLLARHRAFDFALARVETWPGVVWLAPEPDRPFRALTTALHEAFPQCPPYGGAFDEVIPHATLAELGAAGDAESTAEALAPRLAPLLPVRLHAGEATLLVEDEPDRWRPEATFALAT